MICLSEQTADHSEGYELSLRHWLQDNICVTSRHVFVSQLSDHCCALVFLSIAAAVHSLSEIQRSDQMQNGRFKSCCFGPDPSDLTFEEAELLQEHPEDDNETIVRRRLVWLLNGRPQDFTEQFIPVANDTMLNSEADSSLVRFGAR